MVVLAGSPSLALLRKPSQSRCLGHDVAFVSRWKSCQMTKSRICSSLACAVWCSLVQLGTATNLGLHVSRGRYSIQKGHVGLVPPLGKGQVLLVHAVIAFWFWLGRADQRGVQDTGEAGLDLAGVLSLAQGCNFLAAKPGAAWKLAKHVVSQRLNDAICLLQQVAIDGRVAAPCAQTLAIARVVVTALPLDASGHGPGVMAMAQSRVFCGRRSGARASSGSNSDVVGVLGHLIRCGCRAGEIDFNQGQVPDRRSWAWQVLVHF